MQTALNAKQIARFLARDINYSSNMPPEALQRRAGGFLNKCKMSRFFHWTLWYF